MNSRGSVACSKRRRCLRSLRRGGSFLFSAEFQLSCLQFPLIGLIKFTTVSLKRLSSAQPCSLANANVGKWAGLCRSAWNEHIFWKVNLKQAKSPFRTTPPPHTPPRTVWQQYFGFVSWQLFLFTVIYCHSRREESRPRISHCAVSPFFCIFCFLLAGNLLAECCNLSLVLCSSAVEALTSHWAALCPLTCSSLPLDSYAAYMHYYTRWL